MKRDVVTRRVLFEAFTDSDTDGRGELVLRFDAADPLVVTVEIDDENVWAIARTLLLDGLRGPAGIGDVHIAPYHNRVAVTLTSHEGRALLLLQRSPVEGFAQQIRDINDTPDIDRLVDQILDWGTP